MYAGEVLAGSVAALHAGVGVVTSIGRLDCATLVLDGYLPVHPGRAGVTASKATLTVELREGRAAAACAGGAFAGGSASTNVAIRCGPSLAFRGLGQGLSRAALLPPARAARSLAAARAPMQPSGAAADSIDVVTASGGSYKTPAGCSEHAFTPILLAHSPS